VIQWDFDQPSDHTLLPIADEVTSLAYSDDGKLCAIAAMNGPIRVYDSGTAQLKAVLEAPAGLPPAAVGRVVFGPDHRILFAAKGKYLLRFDVESGQPTTKPRFAHSRPFGIWLAPNGKTVATLSPDDRLCLWESKNLAPLVTGLPCYGDWGNVAFDATGERIFVTARSARVAVFDAFRGSQLALLEPGLRNILHLQFCTESDTLVVFGQREQGVLQLWRAPSLAEIEQAESAGDEVWQW
jgi:WD40 repeat protein